KIATSSKYAYGGADGVLATNFGESPFPMFTDPPGCYLHHQATFIQDFIQKQFPTLKPGEDFDFFAFPPIEQGVPKAVEDAGDLMPEAVNAAFWKGTLDYVRASYRLDAILQNLERVAQEAYK